MAFNPSPWTARIISPATSDTNPSVLITFSDAKYLFNCPEGSTRTFIQRRYGFNKFRSIFLSRISSDTSSGLPGFLMTLADSGTKSLQAYGPPGLFHFLASARSYLVRDSLQLTAVEIEGDASQPIFKDENLTVYAIPVYANEHQSDGEKASHGSPSLKRKRLDASKDSPSPKRLSISGVNSDLHKYRESPFRLQNEEAQSWRRLVISRMFPGKEGVSFYNNHGISARHLKNRLPSWNHRSVATSYLAFGPEYRGKFNSSIADNLGVPPGRDRGRLAKGESITLPDGRVVTPDMVLGSSSPALAFIVVDCPSVEFIPGLIASKPLNGVGSGERYQLHCIIHITPHDVYNDPRYRDWVTQFGSQVHHVIANRTVCSDETVFKSSEEMQKHLSVLDQNIFRRPHSNVTASTSIQDPDSTLKVYPASYQIIGMRPVTEPSDLSSESVTATGAVTDIQSEKIFKGVKEKVEAALPTASSLPGDEVIISCFGTGSAMPGKYRNVSGTLVQIPGKGGILLDCGEGTLGQIRRHFGEEADSVLQNIMCMFLSHIHGDHHIGASSLLVARRNLSPPPQKPLYVIATRSTINYLSEYAEIEDLGLRQPNGIRFIPAESLEHMILEVNDVERAEILATIADLQNDLHLESVKTAAVEHRTLAYGLVIRHKDGWSLTYSGDTMPCQNLVNAGRNSTMLIHEATMADDQVVLAKEKSHSTVGQAIDIARRMKAKKLLLTHFSGRYPKIPILNTGVSAASTLEEGSQWTPETFIAFDFLHIRFGDFLKAQRYLPVLEVAFAELKDDEITVQ